jgi:hypothetical protein
MGKDPCGCRDHLCPLVGRYPPLQRSHRFKALCSFWRTCPGTLVTHAVLLYYCYCTPHQLQQDPEGRGVRHPHPSPEAQGITTLGAGTLQQGWGATAAGSSGALGGTALKQPTPNVTTTDPGRGCSRDYPPTYTGSTAASDAGLLSRLAEHARGTGAAAAVGAGMGLCATCRCMHARAVHYYTRLYQKHATSCCLKQASLSKQQVCLGYCSQAVKCVGSGHTVLQQSTDARLCTVVN